MILMYHLELQQIIPGLRDANGDTVESIVKLIRVFHGPMSRRNITNNGVTFFSAFFQNSIMTLELKILDSLENFQKVCIVQKIYL